ncbi:hypothetical protein K0C01_05925 [Salinarchaeum sp. IM2453]|uniref:DUF7855 family protein n=1 Tax=Salinarchaeum sp. IM2453 TaxID=2862870 RepID=UPI001C83BA69|nr:hypothetical protein [Salinarchaeum sp. IM2453]QZA89656.1 hypothetical protein K0C01_05925 [Salinarchaeum sp. IM2453]
MLLVVTYSQEARQTLRNICNAHEDAIVRRFGRAALLESTQRGALLGLRLTEKHGADVQIERTEPFNKYRDTPERVRKAATAYENQAHANTPYHQFVAGTEYPSLDELQDKEI